MKSEIVCLTDMYTVYVAALASYTVLLHTDMLHVFKDLQCWGRNQVINVQLNKAS